MKPIHMTKPPPIWVWITSASLIVALLLFSKLTASGRTQLLRLSSYPIFKHQLENFSSTYPVNNDRCKVVCWGSSFSCQAIEHSDEMRLKGGASGQNIDVHKMYILSLNANLFPYADELFNTTEQLKPDLICIEDHLFSYSSGKENNNMLINELKHLMTFPIFKRNKTRNLHHYENKNFNVYDPRFDHPQREDTLYLPDHGKTKRILSFADNELLNHKIHFILEQQIPLVILNIPRAGTIQENFITVDKQKLIDQQIHAYREAGFKIEYWKFPKSLPFKYYSDFGHMNKDGRKVFSDWLSSKITEKLAEQCQ